jgi:diacylglycerol kinase family enzyme
VTSVEYAGPRRRCAVIYNPTKVSEKFRALMEDNLQRNGWRDTLWLETSVEDPGRAMTRQAVAEQVDLVIGAGGDGTIRYVADGLACSGIPLGLVPAGTGNLLARNLDLPLEEVDAIKVALSGQVRQIDLVKITVDDRAPEHFAVMAGIGVDAMIMDETDEDLKDKVGSAPGQRKWRYKRLLRGVRDEEVAGSNPVTPTTLRRHTAAEASLNLNDRVSTRTCI